ncbi:MAG: HEPN domain-containing protein [Halobacteriota archaeon]
MFNPLDFLDLAEELKSATDESKIRTSIGRAYYAAFLHAREWLRGKKWTFYGDGRDHHEVQKGIIRYKGRKLKDNMDSLRRDYRNEADYNLRRGFNERDASNAIKLAQIVIKGCSS